jgi:hypothetical protein
MKYDTPHLIALTPAISAIQDPNLSKSIPNTEDTGADKGDMLPGYADFE